MKNVLLVDDEPMIFELLEMIAQSSYRFHYLQEPEELFSVIEQKSIDLILMDWNLDGKSGLEYVKLVRSHPRFCNLPIIMLTAATEKKRMIEGLTHGANDYITKPFDYEILIARLHAQLFNNESIIPVKLYPETFEILIKDKLIKLRRKEFLIFKTLLESPQKTFSRKDLNDLTSGEDVFVSGRSIDTFVRFLRTKVPNPLVIETIRGKGYRIKISNL